MLQLQREICTLKRWRTYTVATPRLHNPSELIPAISFTDTLHSFPEYWRTLGLGVSFGRCEKRKAHLKSKCLDYIEIILSKFPQCPTPNITLFF